jgi:hypothetical protein
MANESAARQARRESARKRKRRGSTSTASRGLVLGFIREDAELEWLTTFVQGLGEKLFAVEHTKDLSGKERVGWIKISKAIAREGKRLAEDAGDYQSFLRILDRVGEDEGEVDLAEIQAELEALDDGLGSGGNAAERREEELHQADLDDRKAWRESQRKLVRLVVFSVLFTAALITFCAVTGKGMPVSAAIAGGMTVGLFRTAASGGMNPFSAPWWASPPHEDG